MTISSVEAAIQHARAVTSEWKKAGFGLDQWREEHTRYALIDPIIVALGWKTWDPRECHPEYGRFSDRGESYGRVDYALFGKQDLADIGNGAVAPDIIIEAKSLNVELEPHIEQLRRYAEAKPSMTNGVAVLTNGREWRLYELPGRRAFHNKLKDPVINILKGDPEDVGRLLSESLDRYLYGKTDGR